MRTSVSRASSRQSKSSIEPRGPPEFDREYARQLSLARQGRNTPQHTPRSKTHRSPPTELAESPAPMPPSVTDAIKDFVSTHVTPLRSGVVSPPSEESSNPPDLASATVPSVPSLPPSSLPPLKVKGRTIGSGRTTLVVVILVCLVLVLGAVTLVVGDVNAGAEGKSPSLVGRSLTQPIRQMTAFIRSTFVLSNLHFLINIKNDLISGAKVFWNVVKNSVVAPLAERLSNLPQRASFKISRLFASFTNVLSSPPLKTQPNSTKIVPSKNETTEGKNYTSQVSSTDTPTDYLATLKTKFSESKDAVTASVRSWFRSQSPREAVDPPSEPFWSRHSFRVDGEEWGALLADVSITDRIKAVALEEIQRATRVTGKRVGELTVREGSLVVEFSLQSRSEAALLKENIDQKLRAYQFPRLKSLYESHTKSHTPKSNTPDSCDSRHCEAELESCFRSGNASNRQWKDQLSKLKEQCERNMTKCLADKTSAVAKAREQVLTECSVDQQKSKVEIQKKLDLVQQQWDKSKRDLELSLNSSCSDKLEKIKKALAEEYDTKATLLTREKVTEAESVCAAKMRECDASKENYRTQITSLNNTYQAELESVRHSVSTKEAEKCLSQIGLLNTSFSRNYSLCNEALSLCNTARRNELNELKTAHDRRISILETDLQRAQEEVKKYQESLNTEQSTHQEELSALKETLEKETTVLSSKCKEELNNQKEEFKQILVGNHTALSEQLLACNTARRNELNELKTTHDKRISILETDLQRAQEEVKKYQKSLSTEQATHQEELSVLNETLKKETESLLRNVSALKERCRNELEVQKVNLGKGFEEKKRTALDSAETLCLTRMKAAVESTTGKLRTEKAVSEKALNQSFDAIIRRLNGSLTDSEREKSVMKQTRRTDVSLLFQLYRQTCDTACATSPNASPCRKRFQRLDELKLESHETFATLTNATSLCIAQIATTEQKSSGSKLWGYGAWLMLLVSVVYGWRKYGSHRSATLSTQPTVSAPAVVHISKPLVSTYFDMAQKCHFKACETVFSDAVGALRQGADRSSVATPHWGTPVGFGVVEGYFSMLELYYLDLLESVMNRELAGLQLSALEGIADEQVKLLKDKTSQVQDLKRAVSLKDYEILALQNKCDGLTSSLRHSQDIQTMMDDDRSKQKEDLAHLREELEQTKHMRDLQAEMVSVLEEQLSRLSKALNEVHTGSRGQSTISGSPIQQGDRSGADISGFEQHLHQIIENDDSPPEEFSAIVSPSRRRSPPKSAKVSSTMVRNPEHTTQYKSLDWQDVEEKQH